MLVENRTIVITDPCYLFGGDESEEVDNLNKLSDYIWESTIYGDWECMTYRGNIENSKKLAEEYAKEYFNSWDAVNYSDVSDEDKNFLLTEFKIFKDKWIADKEVETFTADCGEVGVFFLDELLKIEGIKENLEKYKHCIAIIYDFNGEVKYTIDEHDNVHIIGKDNDGNDLYTTQSGL